MPRRNAEVADLFFEYADLMAITGGSAHRVRAYERAARSIAGYHDDVGTLDAKGLKQVPNVGASIAEKILAYLHTGHVEVIEELRAQIPAGVRQLTAVPTLGPKKAMALYEQLSVSSVDELVQAINAGRLAELKGFGEKTADNILHGISLLRQAGERVHLDVATGVADEIVAALSAVTGCQRCTYAGSLRRMRETIGDIDVLAVATKARPLMNALAGLPQVREVIASGETKTSVRTTAGLQVDLRVVPPAAWGAALQYFTGSKAHNIRVREIAVRAGQKLSEYGLFDAETDEILVSETEEDLYGRLGLPWIPPPLREDRGEIKAALHGELPALVAETDIRGDLHTHTDLTDGVSSLEQMLEAAAGRGYEYYAITDHAPDLAMQQMTNAKMLAQRERVRALDGRYAGLRLLHGTELNIGPDGEVDWPADFLAGFDVCVASVHSHFTQSRDAMTSRLVRVCENPHVHIIGHPTARILGKRAAIDADLDAVFAACARTGTALEIDAYPDRLDLSDEHVLRAKRYGVRFAIDSDAHSTGHLGFMRFGIGTAQRGWLTGDDVINTWRLDRLQAFLRKEG
ncbi:MAG: DNA polymerase/3'-5' exonuclease PolX [Streptosporangiales bacterium]